MIAESKIDWTAEWREELLREGETEGRRRGEADLLLRQLNRLHGPLTPAIEDRIRKADANQLLEWGERLVTSKTLEGIFNRDP